MLRYEFTNKYNRTIYIPHDDTIVLDLKSLNGLSDSERDFIISEHLMHEHLHRIMRHSFGKGTSKLIDLIYHKFWKAEYVSSRKIYKRANPNKVMWDEVLNHPVYGGHYNEFFNDARKMAKLEHRKKRNWSRRLE